jgi:hypothetical protein
MTLFRRLDTGFHRCASANEVAVSINIVHAVDRRPVFIDPEGAGRKAGGLARIGPVPVADEVFDGVRGAFFKGLFSLSMRPSAMARVSSRMVSIASQREGIDIGRLNNA